MAVTERAEDGAETLKTVRPEFGEPLFGHAAPDSRHPCRHGFAAGSGGRFKVSQDYQYGYDKTVQSGRQQAEN